MGLLNFAHAGAQNYIYPVPPQPAVGLLGEMSTVAAGGQPCHLFYGAWDSHQNNGQGYNIHTSKIVPNHLAKIKAIPDIKLNWLTVSSFLHPCIFFRWVCKKMKLFQIGQYLIICELFCPKWLPWWSGPTPSDDYTLQRPSRFVWLGTKKMKKRQFTLVV